jgi:hypothetical protein
LGLFHSARNPPDLILFLEPEGGVENSGSFGFHRQTPNHGAFRFKANHDRQKSQDDVGIGRRARREVLARATFHVLGVLLQQPLESLALHVGGEAGPLLLVYEVHNLPAELGRILDFVLRLAENDAEEAVPFPQLFNVVAIRENIVPQDIAVIPKFLNQCCGIAHARFEFAFNYSA